MNETLEQLVGSLLYEGYALYPYTPEATKNATPTPFGIVYPPVYAAECAGAHDHARLECVARCAGSESAGVPIADTTLTATLCWLAADGDGHRAAEQRLVLGPASIGERVSQERRGLRFTLRSEPLGPDRTLARVCVHNTTEVASGLSRADALADSLISTHIVVECSGATFVSPLEAGRESVNTWPVLATPADDAVLGAAIVLPDHPRISDASHGNLFDNTEIEEALVLHVHAMTDAERESASAHDRAVGDMLERALALGPQEIIGLHSGLHDSGELATLVPRTEPPVDAAGRRGADDNPGERRITVDGVTYERGGKLVLRPGTDRDPYDRMLDGHPATIERIYVDFDNRVHLAVTVDDDPGQQLMRESGRYLFFFADEVEAV